MSLRVMSIYGTGGIIVLVTGGRAYNNKAHVFNTLDAINDTHGIALVVEGGAGRKTETRIIGADLLAREWCIRKERPWLTMPAPWRLYGRAAGPRRNRFMLENPWAPIDLVVAFPGGVGTNDCVTAARALDINVMIAGDEVGAERLPNEGAS